MNVTRQGVCFEWGFNKKPLLTLCLKYKVCCVTHRTRTTHAVHTHHTDAIGRGFNRNTYDDSNHRKMMLSAEKHHECHTIGQEVFNKKYGVFGVLYDNGEVDNE